MKTVEPSRFYAKKLFPVVIGFFSRPLFRLPAKTNM